MVCSTMLAIHSLFSVAHPRIAVLIVNHSPVPLLILTHDPFKFSGKFSPGIAEPRGVNPEEQDRGLGTLEELA